MRLEIKNHIKKRTKKYVKKVLVSQNKKIKRKHATKTLQNNIRNRKKNYLKTLQNNIRKVNRKKNYLKKIQKIKKNKQL